VVAYGVDRFWAELEASASIIAERE
jgi:hypothetical protein